jgi:hypothetical protein
MFALYCDDSGTHQQSPFAVAACFVADVVQWEHFVKDWNEANEVEKFGTFHMAAFVAKQKQFALPEWQDEEKRDRTLKRLITIIKTRRRMGFFAVVEKSGYDAEVPPGMRERYKLGNSHYSFAVRMVMAQVLKWRRKYGYREPIQFVFDQMSKGKGEINAIFEKALNEGDEQALVHGISREAGWSFQSKSEVVPLQAADVLAWESLHDMRSVFLAGRGEARRKSFQALLEGPIYRGFHDAQTLRDWVRHVKERTNASW